MKRLIFSLLLTSACDLPVVDAIPRGFEPGQTFTAGCFQHCFEADPMVIDFEGEECTDILGNPKDLSGLTVTVSPRSCVDQDTAVGFCAESDDLPIVGEVRIDAIEQCEAFLLDHNCNPGLPTGEGIPMLCYDLVTAALPDPLVVDHEPRNIDPSTTPCEFEAILSCE